MAEKIDQNRSVIRKSTQTVKLRNFMMRQLGLQQHRYHLMNTSKPDHNICIKGAFTYYVIIERGRREVLKMLIHDYEGMGGGFAL